MARRHRTQSVQGAALGNGIGTSQTLRTYDADCYVDSVIGDYPDVMIMALAQYPLPSRHLARLHSTTANPNAMHLRPCRPSPPSPPSAALCQSVRAFPWPVLIDLLTAARATIKRDLTCDTSSAVVAAQRPMLWCGRRLGRANTPGLAGSSANRRQRRFPNAEVNASALNLSMYCDGYFSSQLPM